MRPFRLFLLIYIFAVFGILYPEIKQTLFAQQHMTPKEENVCFRWAFGALTVKGKNHILTPITKDTTLKTGDQFKIFLELQKECFVYLIYHSSQDSLYMLFPPDLQQFVPGYNILKKNYIPQGNMWFTLNHNIGIETFYLLGSAQRLNQLESFFCQYGSAQPTQKEELKQKILAEIKNLRWQYRNSKKHAERPVSIIGNLRGGGKIDKPVSFDLVDLAIAEQDHATNNFLQWFVAEQVEEEASADEVVQKIKLMGDASGGLFMLDQELAQRVFTPPAAAQ